MRENLLKVAVTPENPTGNEARRIALLLASGWDRVHLRHPGASRREMSDILGRIDPRLHGKIVLHGHFDLIDDFNIGGLHLNSRCPIAPKRFTGMLSRSLHSLDELAGCGNEYDYVTLSPIFDSISKSGYQAAFTFDELGAINSAKVRVVALGGITPETLPLLVSTGFSGFAALGALGWESDETEFIKNAKRFTDLCSSL